MGGAAAAPSAADAVAADEPQPPPPPPLPSYARWLTGWRAVHVSVAAAAALLIVGVVIARIDAYEWRRHHVRESEYDTFLFPCEAKSQSLFPYCWPTVPIDTRIADLLSRMTTAEKLGLLTNTALGVPRLFIPAYQWWNEALHGVAISPGVVFAAPTPSATSFPQVIGTASSFNATLWSAIGAAVSTEARAFSNAGHAGLTFWAPNLNIFRDPRWGRGQETPGEDPLLNGDYTAAYVRAMQGATTPGGSGGGGDAPGGALKVSACCKHFDAYSLEDWGGVERYGFDAVVGPQDLADTYLPAFRECVVAGGASCIMCAYNAVNGVPMCANKPFLTELARDAWGFDGYITSDCDAVANVLLPHNYTRDMPETIGVVMDAGLDIDCGASMNPGSMAEAMTEGYVSAQQVDAALARLFRVQFRLGMFDPAARQPLRRVGVAAIDTAAHRALALDAARQSFVLLKNAGGALPLPRGKAAAGAKVALVGPHGNATAALQSNYFGVAPFLITPLQGITAYAPGVVFAPGCADVLCPNATGFDAATSAVKGADVIILAVGLSLDVEREGMDRVNLTLPGMQPALIDAVLAAAAPGATVIMLLLCGGAVDVSAQAADPRIAALLWVGYPGQAGGTAIAEALWGVHAPAGRLTQTWYPAAFAEEVSMFDMNMRPNAAAGTPGRGDRFYTGDVVFPFGAGLSYTDFALAWGAGGAPSGAVSAAAVETALPSLRIDARQRRAPPGQPRRVRQQPRLLGATVLVRNAGGHAAPRVVLAFMYPPPAAVAQFGAPRRALVWYGRTPVLKPGDSVALSFELTAREFAFAGPDGLPMLFQGDWLLSVDGLNATLTVGDVAAGGGNQPRYRQHDWAAISGAHGRSDGDGRQRLVQRAEGFAQPAELPGVR